MSITVTLFLVLLFAISDTSPPSSTTRLVLSPSSPHPSLSCPRILSCLASGASSPCLVLSYIFPPLSPSVFPLFRSVSLASSAFCWMTHIVQILLFLRYYPSAFHPPPLRLSHIVSLPSSDRDLGFAQAWKSPPVPSPLHTFSDLRFGFFSRLCRHLWLQRRSSHPHSPFLVFGTFLPLVVSTGCISVA